MNTIRILILCAAAVAAPALAQREAPVSFDAWGYSHRGGGDAACPYQYVDLQLSGSALTLVPAGALPASDEGAAVLELAQPFEFYGEAVDTLVASSNGYLAVGATADDEDGGYWRSDCPLPAIPDNARAWFGRVQVLQGDLEAGSAGQLLAEHFPVCPRPAAAGLAQACTIVQWRDWRRFGGDDSLDMQAVLYHATWEIALQYRALPAAGPDWMPTVGLQDVRAASGWAARCGGRLPTPKQALCLFDPRFPPPQGNDLLFADGFESGGD